MAWPPLLKDDLKVLVLNQGVVIGKFRLFVLSRYQNEDQIVSSTISDVSLKILKNSLEMLEDKALRRSNSAMCDQFGIYLYNR